MLKKPGLGERVLYRGKLGLKTMRGAFVSANLEHLDQRGVDAGHVPALDSDTHLHLLVITPSEQGTFSEYNVAHSVPVNGEIEPGTWCWPSELHPFA